MSLLKKLQYASLALMQEELNGKSEPIYCLQTSLNSHSGLLVPQSTDLPNGLMLPTQKVLLRLRDLPVWSCK